MASITDFNKGSDFVIDFSKREWKKLEDIYCSPTYEPSEIHKIEGLFINQKSKYGDRPFVAFDDIYLADLPGHMLESVRTIISTPEIVEQINNGKAGFQVYAYMSKTYNRECYSIRFVDIK